MRRKWFVGVWIVAVGWVAAVTFVVSRVLFSQVVIEQRLLSSVGLPTAPGYGTAFPTVANSGNPPVDGEPFFIHRPGTTRPRLYHYSDLLTQWIEVNSAAYGTVREDFNFGQSHPVSEAYAAAAVTDTAENILVMPATTLGLIHWRFEAPGGPGFAGTIDPILDGVFSVSSLTDQADNEGVDLRFGGDPNGIGYQFNEDLNNSVYCEIRLTIADISEVDILYFGWHLMEAYQDAGAYNGHNTYAFFTIEDALGDLDIETELNGGGTLNDDSVRGEVWADGETHVLRATMSADSVAFSLNGAAVTQVNAVLNADDGDEMVCGMGTVNATGDATPAPGISFDYVEIGVVP